MAERRMLAKSIIDSDMFSNMPLDAQMLYVRLNLAADDDGFVSNPRSIMRMCGASDDCMKLLVAKKFVLSFEVGDDFVFLIKHWKVHNYLRSDRYKASTFKNLLREVYYDENKAYSLNPGSGKTPCLPPSANTSDTDGIPAVYQTGDKRDTQVRLGKDRLGKDSIDQDRIEEGDYKGKPDSFIPDQNMIDHWGCVIEKTIAHGWDPEGQYELAAAKGISRDLIQAYLDKKKEAAS